VTKERIAKLRELLADASVDPRARQLLIEDALPEALDAIEALQTELKATKWTLQNEGLRTYDGLTEEVTRLREALEKIANHDGHRHSLDPEDIARKALGDK
jgi:hypothetical protein